MSELVRRGGSAAAQKAPAKKAPTKKVGAKKVAAKKVAAKKAPAKRAPAKKVAAKKAPAKKAPAKKAPAKKTAKKAGPTTPQSGRARSRTSSTADEPTTSSRAARRALPAPPEDPMAILGLSQPFSSTQLQRAWRSYAVRHHPDQGGDALTFDRGRQAYEALRTEGW